MREKSFGIIPVYKRGREHLYLVVKHRAGHWAFPKGHAEKGESDIEAATRELREETGINQIRICKTKIFEEEYSFTRKKKKVKKTVTYFLGTVSKKRVSIQLDELCGYRWVNFKRALALLTFDEAKGMLKQVLVR